MMSACIKSPVGILNISGDRNGISEVMFTDDLAETSGKIPDELSEAVTQLNEYFGKKRKKFSLKLNPEGTEFQKKVWDALLNVEFGKTQTYQQIANKLGDPKVIRAAASANGKNPIAIIIPCHRIIGSDGSLTGYAGGLHRKKWLLEHESPVVQATLFYLLL
ncbi:MAG: methylated-DNA--[protein]-cysteine S-methyltransferase [Bacteroidia bacterium]|nr:methylated-DNA--[protein]-cysteine S-methyltransferase [Bacteroidia bacterium]NNJ82686.1 methylated-DNA--[protein]-cysteine S-methyltransferase [Flavobacteriaceae bacterium]NNK53033.1 methylated-DNA--[protein]-cysteine S-methyltransferase [Flavobacteriaceae bacterium]